MSSFPRGDPPSADQSEPRHPGRLGLEHHQVARTYPGVGADPWAGAR
ncbi:hypothetical protein ACIO3O_19645 [Streptomyces sp. NPDC087440]